MDTPKAAQAISEWFAVHARPLPWRVEHQPYHVLVAEFILQQTRMEVGVPRFASFIQRFPTIHDLARARESNVLAEWSGLGYYQRARNLHAAAKEIVSNHGGTVPKDPAILRELPGIGPYTAGAIASIAYDQPEPSLDGNQFRVLGRYLGVDAASKAGRERIDAFSRGLLQSGSPRILNQAIMDLGGSVCVPENPRCDHCPLFAGCATRGPGERKPARAAKSPIQEWFATRFVRDGRVFLVPPRGSGLLGAHWMPPLEEGRARSKPDLEHTFSHRQWRIWWKPSKKPPTAKGRWVNLADLERLPHGPVTRKFVEAALTSADASSRPRRARASARAGPSPRRA